MGTNAGQQPHQTPLPYGLGEFQALGMLGLSILAGIYVMFALLFARAFALLLLPAVLAAIGFGLLRKRRFGLVLLLLVLLGASVLVAGALLKLFPFMWWRGELIVGFWLLLGFLLYWLPFVPYYLRRWRCFQ